jgi:peptide/nickel transport system substrate-binding protein
MMTTEAYPEFYNATLVMKQQLEAAGFAVDFQVYDWGTMLTRLGDTTTFDLYPMNYPFASNPASVMTLMKTDASGFTNDEKLNDYIIEMQAMPTFEEAIAFWKDTVQPYCAEEVFIINLGSYDFIYGVSDKVSGFDPYYGLKLWGVKVAE